jgi:hypothetical protein
MSNIDVSLLHVGSTILYRLLPCQCPTNPNRLWKGKILSLHIGMPASLDVALVESLEPDYELLTEFVLVGQIEGSCDAKKMGC